MRQRGETDQVDEPHRHPEEGPVAHVLLRPPLPLDPVAKQVDEDGARPAPNSSAFIAAAELFSASCKVSAPPSASPLSTDCT